MPSALQTNMLDRQRACYESLERPLLAQMAALHQVSVREFAGIFGISKSYAEEILNHKKLPSLELAYRIARYWEVGVDDLFGWRIEDDGQRRPLLVSIPCTKKVIRLSSREWNDSSLGLVMRDLQGKRKKKEAEAQCSST